MVQPTRGSRGEHRLAEASGVRNHGMSICCAKCQLEWKCLPRRWYYFSVVYGGKLAEDIRRSSTEVSVQKRRKNHTHHTRFKRVHQFWAISWNHIKLNFCSVEELLFSSRPWSSTTELYPHQNQVHRSRFTSVPYSWTIALSAVAYNTTPWCWAHCAEREPYECAEVQDH